MICAVAAPNARFFFILCPNEPHPATPPGSPTMPKLPTPFGHWPSPITPHLAAAGSRRYGSLKAEAGAIYWSQSRPEEGGRQTILQGRADGSVRDLLAAPFSARSRVHEYGGGEFSVVGETIYFTNDSDQQIYAVRPGEAPRRLTNAPNMRFADYSLDDRRQRLIGVGERHAGARCRCATCWWPSISPAAASPSSPPPTTSMPPRVCRPPGTGSPSWPGICRTCHGTAPPCSWPPCTRTARSATPSPLPAATARPPFSRHGAVAAGT